MANSLFTGVSGLTAHQKMIEVVGHNLANLNTTGFKTRSAQFADVFYETISRARPASGDLGGSNPAQVGGGSKLASVAVQHKQGGLDPTGGQFDFAIDGNGFFVLTTDEGTKFTRDGAFGLDANGVLVDVATGFPVQRFGTVGDVNNFAPSFQIPGNPRITVPIGAAVPGEPTTEVNLRGNLSPANISGTTHVLSTTAPWTVSGGAGATSSDLINSLDFVTTPFTTGDTIDIIGSDRDGNSINDSVAVDGSSTIQDLVDGIAAAFPGTIVVLEADGRLSISESQPGQSQIAISLDNGPSNTGQAVFAAHEPITITSGFNAEIVRSTMEVFDDQGTAHQVGLEIQKEDDDTWTLLASVDPASGVILDGRVDNIVFNPVNGTFTSAGTPGLGDENLVFRFNGLSTPQAIRVHLGDPGTLNGLTSNTSISSVSTEQNGSGNGTLVSTNVDESGIIEGVASNGRRFPLAQLAVAAFRNPNGLESDGDNIFRATTSSGTVELGPARSGGRGTILAGQLEQSNVDIAVEFTRLIIAQRGFSANARTITVTDEMLEELTNLLR